MANDSYSRWQLEPPSALTRVFLLALAVVLPVGIAAGAVLHAFANGGLQVAGDRTTTLIALLTGLLVLAIVLWLVVGRMFGRHRITLHDHALDVTTTFYRRSLALAELRLDEARVVDLGERTELRPMLKTNGTGLPGLKSGWFRLRNRSKALVATVGGNRVLWLPTRSGYDLLLQPHSPQALLDELRRLANTTPRR